MLQEQDASERNRLIGKNLRKYRILKGLTQDELTEGICSVSQLSKAENGKTYLNRLLLRQMAERLGVSLERIETLDPLQEELREKLQTAKDARKIGKAELALQLSREVKEQSREFRYPQLYTEAVLVEVRLFSAAREYESAIALAQETLSGEAVQDPLQQVELLYEKGFAEQHHGNLCAALDSYSRASDLFESVAVHDDLRMSLWLNLSKCQAFMKNYRTALRFAEKAEQLGKERGWFLYRLRASYMQAGYWAGMEQFGKAEELMKTALQEANNNGHLLDAAVIHVNMALVFQDQGQYGIAYTHFHRAMQVLELFGEEYDQIRVECMVLLADNYYRLNEPDACLERVENALEIVQKIGSGAFLSEAKALLLHGWVQRDRGDMPGYLQQLEAAVEIYVRHHALTEAYDTTIELADWMYEQGDARAVEYYRRAHDYHRRALEFGIRR